MNALSPLPCKMQRGAALVVVLSFLVLLAAMVLAFFFSVESEVRGSSARKDQVLLKRLTDLPTKLVEAQIRAATTHGISPSTPISTNAWTSQPGLLRVYDQEGDLVKALKLYSSATMEESDIDFLDDAIPDDWPSQPARWVDLNAPSSSVTDPDLLRWPILNPNAVQWAEGLSVAADPAGVEGGSMPVEWLYVMEDGSLRAADALAAGDEPVGRIAFWTDDESCKINLNTAGERTMWDRPRAWHEKLDIYSKNQPSTGEFQAYPGHPATVSLSAALGGAVATLPPTEAMELLLGLTPRYRWGGSEGSTRTIWDRAEEWQLGNPLNQQKHDRLYATGDEFLLSVARDIQDTRLRQAVQESGFLLTEASRSPELNLFGLPRVGIWPIVLDPTKRTAHDRLIARGTTVGDRGFYFQRADPLANNEATAIPRNWELLEYLDRLTSREISGFGGSFNTKWGSAERRQILTEIFDYVRGATNLSDTSRNHEDYALQFTPATSPRRGFVMPTKIPAWDTRGLGRAPVLTHASILFYAYQQEDLVKNPNLPQNYKTEVKALLWFNFFNPMQGLAPASVRYRIRLTSVNMAVKGVQDAAFTNLMLKGMESDQFLFPRNNQGADWGGYEGMLIHSGIEPGSAFANYAFESANSVPVEGTQMNFAGGPLNLELIEESTGRVIQSYRMEFPSSATAWPVPLLWAGSWNNLGGSPPNWYFQVSENALLNPLPFAQRDGNAIGPSGFRITTFGRRDISSSGEFSPPVDVVRSVELRDGDARIIAGLETVDPSFFTPGDGYQDANRRLTGTVRVTPYAPLAEDLNNPAASYGRATAATYNISRNLVQMPILPRQFDGKNITSLRDMDWAGDLDNGFLGEADGPYANKPDEGHALADPDNTRRPYFSTNALAIDGERLLSWDPRINGFFSPTRQVPSAVMFGSLPTTVKRTEAAYRANRPQDARPWETLLFSPNSQAAMVADGSGNTGHPGEVEPKDHLLLDLFTMPVVEPYAISEPFSTAGKINLNQRVIPFAHIQRETALYGALKGLEFMATRTADSARYRSGSTIANSIRRVHPQKTMAEIAKRLDPDGKKGAGAFRSASEICEIFLIPEDKAETGVVNWTTPSAFWNLHQITGDNSREAPYNYLYPLLTTKSNSYRVHYKVELLRTIKGRAGSDPLSSFVVVAEQQGSVLLERYLDINDAQFLKDATDGVNPETTSLEPLYRFRTVRHQRFIPGL